MTGVPTTDELPPQLWLSREGVEPDPERFEPVGGNRIECKPYGGLWTSSQQRVECGWTGEVYPSDWLRWCYTESWIGGTEVWRLMPEQDLEVVEVDGLDDLRVVMDRFGQREEIISHYEGDEPVYAGLSAKNLIDFETMAEQFDGMRVTVDGQAETRITESGEPDLYGWDSESVLWFRFAFEEWEFLGEIDPEDPESAMEVV